VNKFLLEVNGVVGLLFKVCESYSEAYLYLKEHFVQDHPTPSNVTSTDSPPLFTKVASSYPSAPPG
jgi:benzoyl-CoA reductase/2-hydroxyglutaryl-CoA dehydratase subunit BcrC/BadD/HgdB